MGTRHPPICLAGRWRVNSCKPDHKGAVYFRVTDTRQRVSIVEAFGLHVCSDPGLVELLLGHFDARKEAKQQK